MDASEFFDICAELIAGEPSADATRRLHEVLRLCCAEGCRRQGGAFGNLFAQVDYLCKHLHLSPAQTRDLQDARRHTNTGAPVDAAFWPYDVKAVARLVSAVFVVDIPSQLVPLLPADERQHERGLRINKDYVRCIVSRVTPSAVYADTADGPIVIDYRNTAEGRDFAYLQKVLRPGMQLNLLDNSVTADTSTNEEGGGSVIIPGNVVVEPDFLIDISSLAACFTDYGHHTLLYTVNRLKPKPNTQATLLGNFAGTALDDVISRGDKATLAESLQRSFREQALCFCACEDFNADQFRQQAAEQMKNIREAVKMLGIGYDSIDKPPLTPPLEKGCDSIDKPPLTPPLEKEGNGCACLPLLEASFVCERLGLQGRVDLMASPLNPQQTSLNSQLSTLNSHLSTLNSQHSSLNSQHSTLNTLLVEQKSGRNTKIEYQSHDSHGLQLENHYVQLLLYYGVLRYNFGLSDRQVDIRLLYSRYPAAQGLLTVNYYRTLLREALMLRNQIVATELLIARDGFGRILPLLNADIIYKGIARDGFFHHYVLPGIEKLSYQFASLSPIERAYVERMLTFVYREQCAQKVGSSETSLHHAGGCTADLWQMSYQEKIESGNMIIAAPPGPPKGGRMEAERKRVTLSVLSPSLEATLSLSPPPGGAGGAGAGANFRPGDMVYLYSFTDEPDARNSILFKGTLERLDQQEAVIVLNDEQPDVLFHADANRYWAIEHSGSDTGTNADIRALYAFANADQRRRDLLMGQRAPEANTSLQLSRSYHPDYDDVLLKVKQARDYFLLIGPPGTGKTSMALRFMVMEEAGGGVLLAAYTNRAVDEICAMLTDACLPFLRIGKAASCNPRFHDHLLDTALADTRRLDDARQLISSTPIIVSTTSMLQAQPWILQIKHFSMAIIDEASQILEPSLIGLLSSASVERFVLVGDHKQLPAVVQQPPEQSAVTEPLLRGIGLEDCRQSLFERLLRWEHRQGRTQFTGVLHAHGRMHPDVALFPLQHFYQEEQLHAVPLPHQQDTSIGYALPSEDALDELLKTRRVLFLPHKSYESYKTYESYKSHKTYKSHESSESSESSLVADLLRRIFRFTSDHFDPAKTVGVIVPYRRQIDLIRQAVAHLSPLTPQLSDITIDTVERFQGSQRDVIIYALGVSHRYQLDFLTATTFTDEEGTPIDRKLNVALTRARKQMIVVGQPDILSHVPLFRQLISDYAVDSSVEG